MNPLYQWSATGLQRGLASGVVSATDAVKSCWQHIYQENAHGRALITLGPAPALAEAEVVDVDRSKGEPMGLLAGIPVSIKDLTATAGVRTILVFLIYQDWIPTQDDLGVARLKQVRAIQLLKNKHLNSLLNGLGGCC